MSTPYAKLLISVAGAAAASGGQTASAGDALTFSFESTVGWGSPAAKVEIYSYPSSFSAPAGWSTDAAGVIYYQGNTPPPGFTLSANAADWGKYLFRLTVLGGLLNGVAAAQLVDEASGISVASANGLKDVAYLESTQFSASRSWAGALQDCLRTVENALVAGGTYVAGAGLTESPAGTFNVAANADGSIVVNANDIQVGVLATDAQHGNLGGGALHAAATGAGAGFMPAAHFTLVDGATTAADPNTIPKRGASGEIEFGTVTTPGVDTGGALSLGTTNATSIAIGHGAIGVDITGTVTVNGQSLDYTDPGIKTANYTAVLGDLVRCDPTAAGFTVTLPTAASKFGKGVTVKEVGGSANTITIATTGGQTIDGAATYAIASARGNATFISDGTNWMAFPAA